VKDPKTKNLLFFNYEAPIIQYELLKAIGHISDFSIGTYLIKMESEMGGMNFSI